VTKTEEFLKKKAEEKAKVTFDVSIFQGKQYILNIYNNAIPDLTNVNNADFLMYTSALVGELGGDQILYVDAKCKPLISSKTVYFLDRVNNQVGAAMAPGFVWEAIARSLGKAQAQNDPTILGNPNDLPHVQKLQNWSAIAEQGNRDAVTIVNRYTCDSDVARRIAQNILANLDPSEPPAVAPSRPQKAERKGPSFNCDDATSSDQVAICSSPELANLDLLTNDAYHQLMAMPEVKRQAISSTRSFLESRGKCNGSVS
jgi:hypothetical protein